MENQKTLSDPLTLRLPTDVLAEIEQVARITGRSRSWIMVRAMKSYLAAEGQEIVDLHEARIAASSDGTTDLGDLLDRLDALPGTAA